MSRAAIGAIVALLLVIIIVSASTYTVNQTEQALITQFGQPVGVISKPGLHFKTPFVQTVIPFDRRLLDWESPGEEVILSDQRRLIVDTFTRYRITNPLQYFQSVGPLEDGIQARLGSVVTSSLRRVLGGESLPDVLSAQRGRIMGLIRSQVSHEMKGFGVDVVDVRIRRADLPPENTQAILSRMQSERQRVAAQARAEGAEASVKIRANAERERTVLLADASGKADQIRGEGDAQAIAIYANAAQQDPKFFTTWLTLQAYRAALTKGTTRLVLTPDNPFLGLLQNAPTP